MEADLEINLKSKRSRRLAAGVYFFIFAAIASVAPFFVLYLQSLGFSGAQIGSITSLGPMLGLVGTPIWTGFADARNRHRVVLVGGIAVGILINLALPFLRTYPLIFASQVLLALLTPHLLALQDSATIHALGKQRDRYGQVRIWGTVGWGVSAPIVGALLGHIGLVWMFWLYAGFMAINLLLASRLEFEESGKQTAYFKDVGSLLKDRQWLLFLAVALVGGLGMSPHTSYLPLLVQQIVDQNGMIFLVTSVSAMVGLALSISTVFEAPIMLLSHRFLARFGSRGTIFIAMAVIALRNLLYAKTYSSLAILALQILHGLTYPLLWIAGVSFVAEKAPKGLSATAQGVFSAAIMGVGMSSGNFFCGWLIDQIGVYRMFNFIGLLGLAFLLIFLFLSRKLK
jgi:PPP family 3-phenylpropionic acid transporter